MSLAWAFVKRDAAIELSYKTSFVIQMLGTVVLLAIFYYLGQLMDPDDIEALDKYGGSFLAFLLIGVALTDCVGISLTTFAKQIREGQLTGSFEVTLMSPVSLQTILICSALWPHLFSAIRFFFYLMLGTLMYSVELEQANLTAGLLIFVLTVLSFAGVGMLWASVVLVIKRGEALITVIGYLVIIVSGTLFPPSLLPNWLQSLAKLIPLTHGLHGMRLALLQGYGIQELWGTIVIMMVFTVTLIAVGLIAFNVAVHIAKRTGTLSQY
jgi:ABC-2 type transport system permease protein